jgi:EAL domain-containing protein (putative c-di-GMP-specific phosphodiesterase class I)
VRFSVDDFGTGYSSLSYLRQLPIHEIRIDKRFISEVPDDVSAVAIVEATLPCPSAWNSMSSRKVLNPRTKPHF